MDRGEGGEGEWEGKGRGEEGEWEKGREGHASICIQKLQTSVLPLSGPKTPPGSVELISTPCMHSEGERSEVICWSTSIITYRCYYGNTSAKTAVDVNSISIVTSCHNHTEENNKLLYYNHIISLQLY